jgi:hypothetical protein
LGNYINTGGEYVSVYLIFAGFDKTLKKQINSSQYGQTLVNTFIPGKKQMINKEIVQKLFEATIQNRSKDGEGIIGSLNKDTLLEIDSPYSSIVTVEINLPRKPIIKKVDCYKCVMKAPNGLDEINLPEEFEKPSVSQIKKLPLDTASACCAEIH